MVLYSTDFVVPMKHLNLLTRTVMECLVESYHPKTIFVITPQESKQEIERQSIHWNIKMTKIVAIDEETFFGEPTKTEMEKRWYHSIDDQSREFGWWFQQVLKVGAFQCIRGLSDPYVVWDSDLVAIEPWNLYPTPPENPHYTFAILQEKAKNEWNREQYFSSIRELIGLNAIEPEQTGTFVPHHFIMYHHVLRSMFETIENLHPDSSGWMETILRLSEKYYRFSEYKCLATYMKHHFPELLVYHPFERAGNRGIRFREKEQIVEEMMKKCALDENQQISYGDFRSFIQRNIRTGMGDPPSYVQIEHL
jgi:hypothetical protein